MKRVVCVKDIEEAIQKNEKIFYVNKNYILTPSAIDLAKENNIEIVENTKVEEKENISIENIDKNQLVELLKVMMKKGVLEDLVKGLREQINKKYESESDESGFKLIRGNTVKMERFDTGNSKDRVYFQELIEEEEAKLKTGFFTIEESEFDVEAKEKEIHYIIDGILRVEINRKTYEAYEGDVIFIPKESKVKWNSVNKVKTFYISYLM